MADFARTPLENQFETQLVGEISSGATVPFDITVKKAISFTPQSDGFRIILESGTSKEEGMIITAVSGTTWTVGTRGVPKAKGGASTTTTHGGGVSIIITDTWSTFDDMATSINSKLEATGETVSAFDLKVSGTNWRIREDAGDMKLTDDSQAEVSLATLAAAAGVDDKFKISNTDTTSGYANSKLTVSNGIKKTQTGGGGNETLDFEIDTSTLPSNLDEANTFFGATDMTGAEAETLTDGSDASALHNHGTPSSQSGSVYVSGGGVSSSGNADIDLSPFDSSDKLKIDITYFTQVANDDSSDASIATMYSMTGILGDEYAGWVVSTTNSTYTTGNPFDNIPSLGTSTLDISTQATSGTGHMKLSLSAPVMNGNNLRIAWTSEKTGGSGTGHSSAIFNVSVVATKLG